VSRYFAYGLTIDSDFGLPGAIALAAGPGAPEVRIQKGSVNIGPGALSRGAYRYLDGRLLFDAPRVARYLCEAGEAIVIERAAEAKDEAVEGLLIATALPAILWMRDRLVLHAAAAVLPGCHNAIAIAGASGAGKTTILHQLVEHGAAALADDSVALAHDGQGRIATGLPAGCFLRDRSDGPRRFVPIAEGRQRRSARLGALVVLEPGADSRPPTFERAAPLAAVSQALRNRHRPTIPLVLGRAQRTLMDCAMLAREVPIYVWRRRNGSVRLAEDEMLALTRAAGG
jgi:hypothetical protein